MEKQIKLSPSSLNLFVDCKRCFWLHIIEKFRRPPSIFPSLPSGMDKILKEHFDKFMAKGEMPPELKEHKDVKGCVLFNDKEKLNFWRKSMSGMQYVDPASGVILRGGIDNILVKGNKLIILDYKTRGYPLKENSHEYYQLQMDLYNFMFRKNKEDTEDYAILLFYYPIDVNQKSGEIIFEKKLIKMPTDPENGEKVFQEAIKVLAQEKPPISNPECQFCKYKNSK